MVENDGKREVELSGWLLAEVGRWLRIPKI